MQTLGIIGSFALSGISWWYQARMRRASALIELTEQHRRLWSHLVKDPKLERVLEATLDLEANPVTISERMFVGFVILHVDTVLNATKSRLIRKPEGLDGDLGEFFSLPLPAAVWKREKRYHSKRMVRYIDALTSPLWHYGAPMDDRTDPRKGSGSR